MSNRSTSLALLACAGVSAFVAPVGAETFNLLYAAPDLDRYVYPFNFSAGAETRAMLFAALRQPGFDDRDAEMLVGFDTAGLLPTGLGRLRYKILSAELSVFVANDQPEFRYDPTEDPIESSFLESDPAYVADSDPGKPIEVWAAGYRNGFSAATFAENTPFSTTSPFTNAEGTRSVYPATLDHAQTPTDVARQARQKFQASAMALARLYDDDNFELEAGVLVPQGTRVRFDLTSVSSENYVYLQNALRDGRLRLLISSLEPASGGPGGGTGGVTYARIYTKENPAASLGYAPRLVLQVAVTCDGDFNGDNAVDDTDFTVFVRAYDALLDARCDLNGDTVTDDSDFSLFVGAYDALLCD